MQLSPSCYAITGLAMTPPWAVNAGFVVGNSKTLIVDTGANWLAAQTIHGYAAAIRPQNELLVFNCEPHFDHVGGNSFFRERDIDVYGHPAIKRTDAHFAAEKEDFNRSIVSRGRAGEAEAFYVNTTLANPNRRATAGDIFDLGGTLVEILATPGHTSINQSVYHRAENVLFCADCMVTDYIPNLEAGGVDEWHKWLDSLAMIEALTPVVILPGHGRVLRGGNIEVETARTRRFVQNALARGKASTK